jgi:hypothetical protein
MPRAFVIMMWLLLACTAPSPAPAAPLFEDGFLGLTQDELRAKLGPPSAVRDRKSALRVFRYYTPKDWEDVFKKLLSPESGEDVYTYTRDGVDVRYSFAYVSDRNDPSDTPALWVTSIDIEFTPAVSIGKLPALVPEFRPLQDASAPAYRSNLWLLFFKGDPVPQARAIVRSQGQNLSDWTLAFQLFSLQGLPEFLTLQAPVDRVEISAQSPQLARQRQKLTHEPIVNPYSPEFAKREPPPPPAAKKVPVPKYAD